MKPKVIFLCLLVLAYPLSSFAQNSSNKEKHVLIDFTVFPQPQTRTTVDTNRIKSGTVNLGTAVNPFAKELKYNYYFVPEFRAQSKNVRFIFRGGWGQVTDLNLVRSSQDLGLEVDGSIWIFDLGADGFADWEKTPNGVKGLHYNADFLRESAGVRGWVGVKVGSFTRNFIMVKIGQGYITTKATKKFNVESVDTRLFDLYKEDFKFYSASAEIGLRQKRFGENLKGVASLYQRVLDSPDPLRFGWNQFRDYKLEGSFEITPSLSHDFFRVLLRGNKTLGDRDGLMFSSDPPDIKNIRSIFSDFKNSNLQIILRLAF